MSGKDTAGKPRIIKRAMKKGKAEFVEADTIDNRLADLKQCEMQHRQLKLQFEKETEQLEKRYRKKFRDIESKIREEVGVITILAERLKTVLTETQTAKFLNGILKWTRSKLSVSFDSQKEAALANALIAKGHEDCVDIIKVVNETKLKEKRAKLALEGKTLGVKGFWFGRTTRLKISLNAFNRQGDTAEYSVELKKVPDKAELKTKK